MLDRCFSYACAGQKNHPRCCGARLSFPDRTADALCVASQGTQPHHQSNDTKGESTSSQSVPSSEQQHQRRVNIVSVSLADQAAC